MNDFIHYAAKAMAAAVVPWVLAVLAWLTVASGVDIAYDPAAIEVFITSVVTALAVYFKRNTSKVATWG